MQRLLQGDGREKASFKRKMMTWSVNVSLNGLSSVSTASFAALHVFTTRCPLFAPSVAALFYCHCPVFVCRVKKQRGSFHLTRFATLHLILYHLRRYECAIVHAR